MWTHRRFTARSDASASRNETLHYHLFTPHSQPAAEPQPPAALLVWLHGGVISSGVGNLGEVSTLTSPWLQRQRPYHILYPVALPGTNWVDHYRAHAHVRLALRRRPATSLELLLRLLHEVVVPELGVQHSTMVLLGASMGGYGVWDVLLRHPSLFGAFVPISGGGDYQATDALVRCTRARLWAFHSREDALVPVNASRRMVTALAATRLPLGKRIHTNGSGMMLAVRQLADRHVPSRGNRSSALVTALESSSADGAIRYTEYQGAGSIWTRHQQTVGLALTEPRLHRWLWLERAQGGGMGT